MQARSGGDCGGASLGRGCVEVVMGVALALAGLPDIGRAGEILVYVREVELEEGRGVAGEGDGCDDGCVGDDMEGCGMGTSEGGCGGCGREGCGREGRRWGEGVHGRGGAGWLGWTGMGCMYYILYIIGALSYL
jgi:hypothetical protein